MPSEEDIQGARFARLDQAIAREIERRQRSHKLYWALLVGAVLLAVLGLVYGRTAAEVAEEVAEDTVKNVAASRGDVRQGFAGVAAELETIRRALAQIEKTQNGLDERLEAQLAANSKLSGRLGKVSSQLEKVGAGLEELEEALRQSQPASFLLKEDELTWLAGLGIAIELGPRHPNKVEGVKIWERKGEVNHQLFPRKGHPDYESGRTIAFGTPFWFKDLQEKKQYQARLTNAQSRFPFWVRDFVGLDLAVTSLP